MVDSCEQALVICIVLLDNKSVAEAGIEFDAQQVVDVRVDEHLLLVDAAIPAFIQVHEYQI